MRLKMATIAAAAGALVVVAGDAAAQIDGNGWYSIAIAASNNQTAEVERLLFRGSSDPDVLDSRNGRTALDYAVSFDNMVMAQLLLDHGAHVDARDRGGGTALHWAAERGSVDMIRLLIAHKATIDAYNREGITALMMAAGQNQPAAVRLLLAGGADPKKQDYTGRDAFGWAAGKAAALQALNGKG